jgi:hypothetical protein
MKSQKKKSGLPCEKDIMKRRKTNENAKKAHILHKANMWRMYSAASI